MLKINYSDLCSLDYVIKNVSAHPDVWNDIDTFDFEENGRKKHLIYYQLDNERDYYQNGKLLFTLKKHDILFAPEGSKYLSVSSGAMASGFGISFDLFLPDNSGITIDEPLKIVANDESGQLYKHFQMIRYCFLHQNTSATRLKGELFTLIDKLFTDTQAYLAFEATYKSIHPAISIINNHPEKNISNSELAEKCYMSTSSFMRKFKQFSGGLTPVQYKNHTRIIRAEEMVNSSNLTLNEIAEMLGFYDAAHLCRKYKQYTGRTLKKR
ncbi:MAG: helix-turn-helix transcriptional regulator [Clostridia bacterium]|nr:helix-turn-helix transcriptional regulator [Clostridia bacterium]